MGELLIWLLAAAVPCLLAGGLVWRRRAEAEREAQRRAAEAAEAQRLLAERAAAERAERERLAAAEHEARRRAERLAEQQRQVAEAQQRRAAEQAEAQRLAELRAEQQRLAAERAETERAAAAQAERERVAAAERSLAAEAEREARRLAAAQAALPRRVPKSAAQTLVLVADDSKVVRIKTGRLLAQHQYQVSYASDGLDALQQLQANLPDVLITDVEMPGMDGFELTRHIRGNPLTAQLPVIMITAADDRHREQADAAGVSVLLGKPYSEDVLISHIRLAMGQDEAETSLV